jgi:hypothetical protein
MVDESEFGNGETGMRFDTRCNESVFVMCTTVNLFVRMIGDIGLMGVSWYVFPELVSANVGSTANMKREDTIISGSIVYMALPFNIVSIT